MNIIFDVFLKGNKVDLVALTEEIAAESDWYQWMNDEDSTENMQRHYFPNTRADQVRYFRDHIENNPKHLQLGIVHKKDKCLIGMISLSNIDLINRRCQLSGMIGEKNYRNVQNITEALKLVMKHAFNALNINKLYGGAIRPELADFLCRGLGFKKEGIRRSEVYKNGRYHDAHLIGILRDEYVALFEQTT